jgi:hypothetical protein
MELVYAHRTRITIASSGTYRISATAVGPFGPDGVDPTRLVSGSAHRGAFPANLGATLPYVVGDGVVATSQLMLPSKWYSEDPAAYEWQRGDPLSWFLFARDAHVRVFVPGTTAARAQVAMRVSRLQVSGLMNVGVRGEPMRSVILPGPSAADDQYDSTESLGGPVPVLVRFELDLQPGWNDVAFAFHSTSDERDDFGSGVISAAVAPDLTFLRTGAAPTRQSREIDPSFTSVALAKPPSLAGDPSILGSVANTRSRDAGIAIALADKGSVIYRVFPPAGDGSFEVNFMHAFPNDWNDASLRVAGIWLIARGRHPKYTGLYYRYHGLPGRYLERPHSLTALPLLVDRKPLRTGPVFLSRGVHVVASGDRQVKIGLLRIAPLGLPPTADLGLRWHRPSSTSITVSAPSTSSPFLLVFDEAYHSGWRATLDGKPLPHVVVNGVANGWIVPRLPAGGSIVLTFAAQTYYVIAAVISVAALIVMIALAWSPRLWPIGGTKR